MPPPDAVVAAVFRLAQAVGNEARNEEIQIGVGVVIEPNGVGEPPRDVEARRFPDILESSVAAIAVEKIPPVIGDVEIGVAVAVVVRRRRAHAKAAALDTRCFGDVGEAAVAIVAIEGVADLAGRFVKVRRAAVD